MEELLYKIPHNAIKSQFGFKE
ncbi:hypothetical protein [Caminicella sporogenes]|nr:hypothetical protein [Caminicella sporogenes]